MYLLVNVKLGSLYTNMVSFVYNCIAFDVVTPFVYMTPVETVTEIGSI